MIRLQALRPIECRRGRAMPGEHFLAAGDDARYFIRRGFARLVDPSQALFAELQRLNAARRLDELQAAAQTAPVPGVSARTSRSGVRSSHRPES